MWTIAKISVTIEPYVLDKNSFSLRQTLFWWSLKDNKSLKGSAVFCFWCLFWVMIINSHMEQACEQSQRVKTASRRFSRDTGQHQPGTHAKLCKVFLPKKTQLNTHTLEFNAGLRRRNQAVLHVRADVHVTVAHASLSGDCCKHQEKKYCWKGQGELYLPRQEKVQLARWNRGTALIPNA